MDINIAGLLVLLGFYLVIFVVGIFAAKRKKIPNGTSQMEQSIVAGRDINLFVGIFTMTATTVGGGYINGTAESIATAGLVWTLAPFGIFIGLLSGGFIFAKRMREKQYLTMLDPFQEVYGNIATILVYFASLCGDVFWTASILSALGTSLSVIVNLPLNVSIITSAAITVAYTMFGQMISVAYTDIAQLLLITAGLVLSLPFVFTSEKVGDIGATVDVWVGHYDSKWTSQWLDLFVAMTFGTIPWQAYFQRVLSVQSGLQAQALSVVGGISALVLVIPSVLIGAAATSADWSNTTLQMSPMSANKSSMVLPYVLYEFTPPAVSILGLGAISAAVMSSMDSSILGSSSMFTNNVYKQLIRIKASDKELLWVQRMAILCIGALATVISLFVPIVYGLFILAADIVFVIVFPQLICAVFFKWTNEYGAIAGYAVGVILRVGAGEPILNFEPFIYYPFYDTALGQVFPFRTFAMISSLCTVLIVSMTTNFAVASYANRSKKLYHLQTKDNDEHQSSENDFSFKYFFHKHGGQEDVAPEVGQSCELYLLTASNSSCT